MRKLEEFDESRFWKRLENYPGGDKTAIHTLGANVRQVVEQAEYISSLICRYLPQYTLHDKTHSLNVLAIMDALTPDEVMEQLTPLECALCIMAAYTHDLGMALTDDEYNKICDENQDSSERQHFLQYRDGFGEELRQIRRWGQKGGAEAKKRIGLMEGHILASYIRETHTNQSVGRVQRWLDEIAKEANNAGLFRYGGHLFKRDLALIDMSHGEGAGWLRGQFADGGRPDGFCQPVGIGEWANLAFPGLLLRLADIMDFDASRTPGILFKHIGIEKEKSILEWNKHLSIKGRDLRIRQDNPEIIYSARCKHPVHEKSIRKFISWIDQELKDVYSELVDQCKQLDKDEQRFSLYLPRKVKLDVQSEYDDKGSPLYIYKDIEFRLDQNEIQQLLMGESLWGDPSLCIRELLQNALDALDMRNLRRQLEKAGETLAEPVDTLPDGEELRVVLTWGCDEESGQEYILVKDNGVGMTIDIITNYFTQIGKSFYRSLDFEREKRAMAQKDLLATPISIFGIGILSCFMIGDRLEVRSCPGGANDNNRQAYNITVSGPGSLFWLKKGTLEHQGTEVKVFLKEGYKVRHRGEDLRDRLREHFDYREQDAEREKTGDKTVVDPAFIAASHVLCPLNPVEIRTPDGETIIRIDDGFHPRELATMDRAKLIEKANEWECPESYIGDPEWGVWKWTDPITRSGVRLWFPRNYRHENCPHLPVDPPLEEGLCRQDELAALVEPQLSEKWRTFITVKGMYVDDTNKMNNICRGELGLINGVGCKAWIDLRGDAAPRLTADRRMTLEPENADLWRDSVHNVFERMGKSMRSEVDFLPEHMRRDAVRNLLSGVHCRESLKPKIQYKETLPVFDLNDVCTTSWGLHSTESQVLLWPLARFLAEYALMSKTFSSARRDLAFSRTSDHDADRALIRHSDRALDHAYDLAADRVLVCGGTRGFVHRFIHTLYPYLTRKRDLVRSHPVFEQHFHLYILQEAFWPDLSNSFPMLNLFHLQGRIGDALLTGPGLVEFDIENDGHTVHLVDRKGRRPEAIVSRGYDLVYPMTAVPLGELRKQCPEWRTERIYRSLGIWHFLLPGTEDIWSEKAEIFSQIFRVDRIFAMMPRFELWSKPFDEWTDEDWETCGLSALWDIKSGRVLWAEGTHHVDEMQKIGKPIEEFLEKHKRDTV
ncbi:hypothetical protein ACFL6S_05530 [Candidatus Poribacteria bacterium]